MILQKYDISISIAAANAELLFTRKLIFVQIFEPLFYYVFFLRKQLILTFLTTVELEWLEHLRDHKISARQRYFEPMRVEISARSGGIIRISLIFL